MERRNFLKTLAAGSSLLLSESLPAAASPQGLARKKLLPLQQLKKPLAIAMWDFSWILRHHRYGEFEHWEKVIQELAERGYDAVRLDVLPQYVAADTDGTITGEFRSVKHGWAPAKWGNDYTMSFRPREALLTFLPLCRQYGLRVGLSSWFVNHNTGPRGIFSEEGGVLRAWTETLQFLEQHQLLDDNIIYVDLLNEFPLYHGFDWFKKEMNARSNVGQFQLNNPQAFVPQNLDMGSLGGHNALQRQFYQAFANDLISRLQARFPSQVFHMSLTMTTPLESLDISRFGTFDYHLWLAILGDIPHWRSLGGIDQALDNRPAFQELMQAWKEKKPQIVGLADKAITAVADKARRHQITCGNTEGWGPVGWLDHPELNWNWVKEAAEIAVDLCKKHDTYKYICTSNFTHPQFKGMWEDVKWHQKITARIKS